MSLKGFAAAAGMLRSWLKSALRTRGVGEGPSRWSSPGTQERSNGYLMARIPPTLGQSRKWEDWELPCYITSFLTVVILGVGLSVKPDLTIETWGHRKARERLASSSNDSEQ